ncbi:CehA/McbA family metallohydrolase [Cohnella luojiensis]|uniref:PHP domain-containing protein n=1 Tax=Cohnella luojiensis TaxID=652876 RepID=A0A4Y8LXZ1_9BACL|nr:CehA/McbA family metallohydrolase [Cohnella luojiensis]TFE26300.1 PHP domain-containing protein [Cohnella luojiensis]
MYWLACELHTHTYHSDGRQTLSELAEGSAKLGFECIALTDHNTLSGIEDREKVEREWGVTIIPGMEWTTFHGHMLTLGLQEFVDWRTSEPHNIYKGISEVHQKAGLVGMAHPYRIGSPICTGCYWEYEIQNWDDIDYIEVWSGTFPSIKTDNLRAFSLWTDRLNEGCRIAATSGRDWHAQVATEEPVSVTYLGLRADKPNEMKQIAQDAVHALRHGSAVVTIGPLVTMEVESASSRFGIGDSVPAPGSDHNERFGGYWGHVKTVFSNRQGLWELPEQKFALKIIGNAGMVAERSVGAEDEVYRMNIPEGGLLWVRAELWGTVHGARALIAFTNAIYFNEGRGNE